MANVITERKILTFSFPTMIALSSSTIMGLINLMIVGRLGYIEVGAVGITNVLVLNLGAIMLGIGYQVNIKVAQNFGRNNLSGRRLALQNGLSSVLIINFPLVLILSLFSEQIFNLMGSNSQVIVVGKNYLVLRLFALFFTSQVRVFVGYLRGMENMKTPMYTAILSNVMNIVLSLCSIYVFNFGIEGVGASYLISEFTQVVILGLIVKKNIKFSFLSINRFKDVFIEYYEGLKIGIQDLGLNITLIFFTIFANRLGVIELAASEILLNILSFCYLPGIAIGVSATTEIGIMYGKTELSRLYKEKDFYKFLRVILRATAVVIIPISILVALNADFIAKLFVSETEIIEYVDDVLYLSVLFLLLDAFHIVLTDTLRGLNDNSFLAILSLSMSILFFVPICYLFTFILDLGFIGMWVSFYIYIMAIFMVLLWRYNRNVKQMILHLKTI